MKDDVNNEVFNETYQILILSKVLNWEEVLKPSGKLEANHVTHF